MTTDDARKARWSFITDVPSGPTAELYQTYLDGLAAHVGAATLAEAIQVWLGEGQERATAAARAYLAVRAERGSAPSDGRRCASVLRSVTRSARRAGVIDWELDLGRAAARRTQVAARRVLAYTEGDQARPLALRDRAILCLIAEAGLRPSEVVGLDLEHLEASRVWVAFRGGRREARAISAVAVQAVAAWVEARGAEPGPLFLNMDRARKGAGSGHRLTKRSLHRIVTAAARYVSETSS